MTAGEYVSDSARADTVEAEMARECLADMTQRSPCPISSHRRRKRPLAAGALPAQGLNASLATVELSLLRGFQPHHALICSSSVPVAVVIKSGLAFGNGASAKALERVR